MSKKLCIIVADNEEDLNLLKEFKQNNNLSKKASSSLETLKNKEERNSVIKSICIKEGPNIKDVCLIEGQKDIKKCTISFAVLENKLKKRPLLNLATDYAMNNLNMEEVYVVLDKNDASLLNTLETNNFESLGDVEGNLTYLKEKTF